ncbi:hypothetical protein [Rhodobaculum claviforme]|uniref:Uncharacterized protein n=1 Tax=Rhodobaculum claviforme TaxID=1549854 RepID=A0A934TJF6_9RHOB|nr:hypothetical protein [Rhodobaculum claviforme]MBK5927275.1 hypothetical protein [Rhodobaculum claviforme]
MDRRKDRQKDTAVDAVSEQLIESGPGEIASVFARAFELAMQIERGRFLGAGLYERTPGGRGYANGYKAKALSSTPRMPRSASASGPSCAPCGTQARWARPQPR